MGAHTTFIPAPCQTCGTPFTARPYDIRTGRKKFCSHTCYTAARPRGFKRSDKTDYDRKKESIARHPEKHRCRMRFEYAKKAGKIVPQPCFVCGITKVEAHHWDYSKPYDVYWLCRGDHIAVHRGRIVLPLPSVPVIPAV